MAKRRATMIGALAAATLLLMSCVKLDVDTLAGDGTAGRANGTPGSSAAQDYLVRNLAQWGVGANGGGTAPAAFRQAFAGGTNIIGIIPGSDLADEYVIVGAHYDDLGSSCRDLDPADNICNGATDNATGVAAALAVGEELRLRPHAAPPLTGVRLLGP